MEWKEAETNETADIKIPEELKQPLKVSSPDCFDFSKDYIISI